MNFALCAAVGAHAETEIRDTEIEAGVTQMIAPLAQAAGIPAGRLKVHIIGDDDFNAFFAGGSDVFVYTGLLIQIKSESAFQAVIAHEMGHMLGGHMAQMSAQIQAEMMRSLIMQALGVGLMALNPMAGAGVLAGSSGIARQSMLSFSRDEERLADDAAVDLMVKANLDPSGLLVVFDQMKEMTGVAETRVNPHNINHPLTGERIRNAKDKIAKLEKTEYKKSSFDFEIIRAKLIGYLQSEKQVASQYPMSDKSDAAIYARAIRFMRSGNLKTATTGTQTLISRHPNNPYFYELLGDIEYQFGHYDDSVAAYEKSLGLVGANHIRPPQIQTALALVLAERRKPGDASRAIELCKEAILTEPQPLTYWVLAKAYGDDDGRGDWARAEFYNMMNKEKDSKRYAKLAQSKLPPSAPEYIKAGDLLSSSH